MNALRKTWFLWAPLLFVVLVVGLDIREMQREAEAQTVTGIWRRTGLEDLFYGGTDQAFIYGSGDTVTTQGLLPLDARWMGVQAGANVTDSLQAAIDSAAVWETAVYLPGGSYTVDSLDVPDGMVLYGDGMGQTQINHAPGYTCPLFYNSADIQDVQIRDIGIVMTANSEAAIKFDDCALGVFERIRVAVGGCDNAAFILDRTGGSGYYNTFYDCSVAGADTLTYGWKFLSGANENRLIACRTTGVDTAVHIANANGIHISDCSFEQFECGIRVPNTASDNTWITNNRFEVNRAWGDWGTGVLVPGFNTVTRLMGNWYSGVATELDDSSLVALQVLDHSVTSLRTLKFGAHADAGMASSLNMRNYNIRMNAASTDPMIIWGTAPPNGSVSAVGGSIYLREDASGSSDSTFYIKTGTGNTGWVCVNDGM